MGKYPVVRVMSTGGMGVIYEAVHPVLGTRVVIKTVLPNLAGNEALADRFRNEALAASRIRDDRLPQIFDIDRLDDNTQYMVMEYLAGEDLQQRLASGPLSVGYSVRVIFEVLEVLHKVHQLGIIHRDITPRNIFLARSDVFGEIPKLLDFGVAHFVDDPNTRPGEVVGSPFYMAPEQVHGRSSLGPWTDVFAAGVVLYELLSGPGVRPWPTTNLVTYLTALATRQPPMHLFDVVPTLPRELCDAVMRALQFEVKDRFRDAASFAQAIEPFAADRALLYDTRHRTVRPDAGVKKVAIENDATIAISSSRRPEALKTSAAARMLAGIQSQLAGMIRKPEGPGQLRARLRQGERRHLTVLLISLQLEEPRESPLDAEDADQLHEQITALVERQLEVFGGHVMPPLGGSLMATFGYERANEDDAERAVSAAMALLEQRHDINSTLTEIGYVVNLRAGVHSGFVTRGRALGRDDVTTGITVDAAKLLERSAPLNGALVSRETLELLGGRFAERSFGKLVLKGRPEPLDAFEILGPAGQEVQRWTRGGIAEAGSFVGRKEQLDALDDLYRNTWPSSERDPGGRSGPASGLLRLCLVIGGPGIGKSRLVHEFLARVEADDDQRTMVLRAQPASAAPYGLWVALLQRLFLAPGGTRFDATQQVLDQLTSLAVALDEPRRSELISQSPVVSFLLGLGGYELTDNHAPTELQGRIQQTLALTLEAVSRRSAELFKGRPAIVAFDNVHRADAASLDILGKVLGAVRTPVPPLLIMAVREPDLPRLPENVSVIRVPLEPMDSADVAAIAMSIAGHLLSTDAERLVTERAAGNPLFVEELVLALRDHDITGADAAALQTFVPTSLFGLILSRVDRLEPELRTTLNYASVLGIEFSMSVFDAVVDALDENVTRAHLTELARRGILAQRREQRDEIFAFRQVLVQSAIYSTVLRDNKRVLHQLAAQAIERLYAGQLDAHLPALFHHYSQTDEVERIVHYARLTGRRAVALGAFNSAVQALMVADTLRERLVEDDPLPAARTLYDLGLALFWSGRIHEAVERVRQCEELLLHDEREDALTVRARCTMLRAETDYHLARWSEGVAHLAAAEQLFQRAGRPFDAAQMACTRGFQLRSLGRVEEGLALARKGWETLKDSNDLPAVVRAGHDLGNILRDVGEYGAALEVFDRAVKVGDALAREGNTSAAMWGRFAARSGRAMTYAAMGRLDEAIEQQRAVYELAQREGTQVVEATTGYHLAHHLLDKGDLQSAELIAAGALRLCSELGLPAREMKCQLLLAQIAERRGQMATSLDHLEAAETLARQSQVGDDAWLDVAELLLAALRAQGKIERAEGLLWEARVRADRNADPVFRVRVAVLEAHS